MLRCIIEELPCVVRIMAIHKEKTWLAAGFLCGLLVKRFNEFDSNLSVSPTLLGVPDPLGK